MIKGRDKSIKKKYNINQEEYEKIKKNQKGVCKICGSPRASIKRRNISFMIDHSHKHGHVRGLLCFSCNIGLGYFKDNIENLKNAIKYLEEDMKKFFIYEDKQLILITISRPSYDKFNEFQYIYSQGVKINKNNAGIIREHTQIGRNDEVYHFDNIAR